MSRFFIFILFTSSVASQASRKFSFKTGASVTIPCRYDRTYIQHKKYWCFDAYAAYNYCTIQAYANETQGKVTVTDNPAESLFTVKMNNLQTENTGMYWCVVEIDGIFNPDDYETLHITVKSDPDLSVMESRVSGEEGGSVTVQCLYSAAYQNKQKQWCRFKDKVCSTFTRTDTSQNSAVHLSDDGRRSFRVQMSGLKKSDAGWYWCSAGDLQVPVHISVCDPPPVVTTAVTTTTHHVSTYTGGVTPIYWYLVALILLLVILVIIACVLRKKYKNQIRTRDRSNDTTVHTAESEGSYSSIAFKSRKKKSEARNLEQRTVTADDSVIYSSVAVSKTKSSASTDIEQDVTYSFVNIASKNKTKSPKDVGDETIYSSMVY